MTLKVDDINVQLGEQSFNFNLEAKVGEVHAILGKSGSGKSTLLNIIGGFLTPNRGEISWNNDSILSLPPDQRPVTTLFQSHNLFDHLSVNHNVALGISPAMKWEPKDWDAINEVLNDVGLPNRGNEKPGTLSGGEQQRVGLARCLLRKKPVLLLDEPYGALDETTRHDMLALTRRVIKKHNLCVLLVTHNPDDVDRLGAFRHRIEGGTLKKEDSPQA